MRLNMGYLVLALSLIAAVFASGCTQQEDLSSRDRERIEEPYSSEPQAQGPPPERFVSDPSLPEIRQDGDLVISDGRHLIEDSKFVIRGNIIVNGTGELIINNSELHFLQDYNTQYWVYGRNKGRIEMNNARLFTNGKWMLFDYRGDTSVKLYNVSSEDPNIPWHGTGDNVIVHVTNSSIGITPWSNVTLVARNSNLFVELGFVESGGIFRLPLGYTDNYDLEIKSAENHTLYMDTNNSTFRAWGTTLFRKANVTFVDTKITIGIDAGADWSIWPGPLDPHVNVSGLKAKRYDDFELKYDTNTLRLINTEVTSWYPQAFREATVEISDSDLADVSSNGQNAHLIIRRSTAQIATARENVTYEFYDSQIHGDVVAQDDAEIFLYNTSVVGQIIEVGNGKVFVDGERVAGE